MGIGLGWRGRSPDLVVMLSITTWQSWPCKWGRLAVSPSLRASRYEKGCDRGVARHSSGRRAVVVTQQATQPLFAHNLAGVR